MSNRRKNNHYHYAEKFDDRRRSSSGKRAFMPFKSVIISLVVLLMFGLTCTTFSVYANENQPESESDHPSILMQARNMKASRDIALTGANADLAGTGLTIRSGTKYFFFDASSTSWTNVQCFVGKGTSGDSSYTSVYSMTKISNTKIYEVTISDAWTDATYIRFVTGCSGWASGTWGTSNIPSSGNYTGTYTGNFEIKKDSVTCWAPAATLSNAPTPTYTSDGYDYYNYDQTIRSYTKDASHTSYSQVNDGGTITGSSYKLNGNASSTASSEADGKVIAAKTATVMLKATPSSGYRFVGWYDSGNNALSNGVGGYTIGTGSDGKPYISYTCTGAKEIRARFIKTYTVTVQRMSGYTGPAPTGGATVDIGSSVTIDANVQTGFNFTGWTFTGSHTGGSASSASTTITPTSNVTATAYYSLKAPHNLALSYDAYKIIGYSSYTPNTNSAQSQTASGSGSVLSYSYDIAQDSSKTINLTKGTDYSVDSSGAVSADYPGKYVVTMTVTDSLYGLTSTATTTTTVEVKPETPVFTYTVNGYTDSIAPGITGTSASTPYKIPINNSTPSTSDFKITSGLPAVTDYTYTWTTTDGTSTMTYTGNQKVDSVTDPGSVLHDRPAGDYTYSISLKTTYNGVDSLSCDKLIYYTVTADFLKMKHFNFDDADTAEDESSVQKIYAVDNNIDTIYAAYEAGGTNFDTVLFFSNDNKSFTPIQVYTALDFVLEGQTYTWQPHDNDHMTNQYYSVDAHNYLVANLPVLAQLAGTGNTEEMVNVMKRSGVKYFKGFINDYENNRVSAAQPLLHTTVGTSSAAGARPIYFKDSNSYSNTRLMAYFLNSSGEMTYQTAANFDTVVKTIDSDRSDRQGIYRFYVPSDAVSVTFAYTTTTGYTLPTVTNGSLVFTADSTIFPAMTSTVELDPNFNMYKISARNADGNGIYDYTGEWTNLDMDS